MSQSPYPAIAAGPPRPSIILRPGQIALPAGMERYQVQGNGAILIDIEAGDTVTIRNVEGGQACELVAWDTDRCERSPPSSARNRTATPPA